MFVTEWEGYTVTVSMTGRIPKDPEQRREVYGTTDPEECFKIDFANGVAEFLAEQCDDHEIVSITKESS